MTVTITDAWNGPGNKDAELTVVRPKDHGLHSAISRRAFEHWYFDARLDTGHTIVGFLTKRRPEQGAKCDPSVEVIVYAPDGTKLDATASFPKDQASFSTEDVDVRIGPNRCWVDRSGHLPVQHVIVGAGQISFDLTFANELPSWMPGKGETYYGPTDHFGWVVAAPRARVSGTVRIGETTLDATGVGYADHNWGVGDMKRIIERWHWGRLYTEDYSLLFANVITQKRLNHHQSAPLMLADRDGVLLSTGEVTLTEGPMQFHAGAGREHPEWIQLEVPGEVTLRLDVERIIDAQDLLDEVPVVRSRAVKPIIHLLLGRPGYFRFDSQFTLTVGDRAPVIGRTLHEMVALR